MQNATRDEYGLWFVEIPNLWVRQEPGALSDPCGVIPVPVCLGHCTGAGLAALAQVPGCRALAELSWEPCSGKADGCEVPGPPRGPGTAQSP